MKSEVSGSKRPTKARKKTPTDSRPRQEGHPNLLKGHVPGVNGKTKQRKRGRGGTGRWLTPEERDQHRGLTVPERRSMLFQWSRAVTGEDKVGLKQREILQYWIRGNKANGWTGLVWLRDPDHPRYMTTWTPMNDMMRDLGHRFPVRTLRWLIADMKSRGILLRSAVRDGRRWVYQITLCPSTLHEKMEDYAGKFEVATLPEVEVATSPSSGGNFTRVEVATLPEVEVATSPSSGGNFTRVEVATLPEVEVATLPEKSAPHTLFITNMDFKNIDIYIEGEKTKSGVRQAVSHQRGSVPVPLKSQSGKPAVITGGSFPQTPSADKEKNTGAYARYPSLKPHILRRAESTWRSCRQGQVDVVRKGGVIIGLSPEQVKYWSHEDRLHLAASIMTLSLTEKKYRSGDYLLWRVQEMERLGVGKKPLPRAQSLDSLLEKLNGAECWDLRATEMVFCAAQMLWDRYQGEERVAEEWLKRRAAYEKKKKGVVLAGWIKTEYARLDLPARWELPSWLTKTD